jgi:type I site-specific deoxyribonuclease specificity subunit protein
VGVAEYLDKPNNKKWISNDTFEALNCEEVFEGDILISRLPEPAGRACIIPKLASKIITAVDCTIVRVSNDTSNKYLLQYLSSQKYFDEVNTCLAGGTRQRISRSGLANFDVAIPVKKSEQEAIGAYFSNLDHLITLHQSKSFKCFFVDVACCTLSWEQRKLWEVCDVITKQTGFDYSTTIKPSLVKEKSDNTYPFIQNKDFNGTHINMNTDFFVPINIAEKFPKIVLDRPSILISISGRIGNVGFYSNTHRSFIGGAVGICKLKDIDDGIFIVQELESEYGQKYFHLLIKASSHANITVEDIRNIELFFPNKKVEKIHISILLSKIDHLITLHQLEPYYLIFKAIAYRIIDYAEYKPF